MVVGYSHKHQLPNAHVVVGEKTAYCNKINRSLNNKTTKLIKYSTCYAILKEKIYEAKIFVASMKKYIYNETSSWRYIYLHRVFKIQRNAIHLPRKVPCVSLVFSLFLMFLGNPKNS